MGYTPDQVRSFSVPEFGDILDGWKEAHGLKPDEPMARSRLDELRAKYPDTSNKTDA